MSLSKIGVKINKCVLHMFQIDKVEVFGGGTLHTGHWVHARTHTNREGVGESPHSEALQFGGKTRICLQWLPFFRDKIDKNTNC